MSFWNDENVTQVHGLDIHEGNGKLTLRDPNRVAFTRDDLAEKAFRMYHDDWLIQLGDMGDDRPMGCFVSPFFFVREESQRGWLGDG